jgi:hypothetical protein
MTLMFLTYLVWAYFTAVKVIYPKSVLFSAPLILRLAGWSLLFGPMGAAMLAIWERDNIVFEVEEQRVKSRKLSPEELASLSQAESKKN